jgi:hypothetical protein
MKEKEKLVYPEYWDLWSPVRKIGWIHETYGKFNEEEDRMEGLVDETPEEIVRVYKELCDIVEPLQAQGLDID